MEFVVFGVDLMETLSLERCDLSEVSLITLPERLTYYVEVNALRFFGGSGYHEHRVIVYPLFDRSLSMSPPYRPLW